MMNEPDLYGVWGNMKQNESTSERDKRIFREMKTAKKFGFGTGSRVMENSVILGKNLISGTKVYVGHFCMLDATQGLTIGDGTMIDDYVCIKTHYHETRHPYKFKTAPTVIGKHCFIGAGVIIKAGSKIPDYTYVPPHTFYCWVPK